MPPNENSELPGPPASGSCVLTLIITFCWLLSGCTRGSVQSNKTAYTVRTSPDGRLLYASLTPPQIAEGKKIDDSPMKISAFGPSTLRQLYALAVSTRDRDWYAIKGGYLYSRPRAKNPATWERAAIHGSAIVSLFDDLYVDSSHLIFSTDLALARYREVVVIEDSTMAAKTTEPLSGHLITSGFIFGFSKSGDLVEYNIRNKSRRVVLSSADAIRLGVSRALIVGEHNGELLFDLEGLSTLSTKEGRPLVRKVLELEKSVGLRRAVTLSGSSLGSWLVPVKGECVAYGWFGGATLKRVRLPWSNIGNTTIAFGQTGARGVFVRWNYRKLEIVPFQVIAGNYVCHPLRAVISQPAFGYDSIGWIGARLIVADVHGSIFETAMFEEKRS